MHIWLFSKDVLPKKTVTAFRFSGLAKYWLQEAHRVSFFTQKGATPAEPVKNATDVEKNKLHIYEYSPVDAVDSSSKSINSAAWTEILLCINILFKNLKLGGKSRPSIILATAPSFFLALTAYWLSRRYDVPFVLEIREPHADLLTEVGKMSEQDFKYKQYKKMETFLIKKATSIVVLNRLFAKKLVSEGADGSKIFVISNGVDDFDLAEAVKLKQQSSSTGVLSRLHSELQISPLTKIVLYLGSHSYKHALGQIVDTARIMMVRSDILFLLVGDGEDKERVKKIARGMPNIQFISSFDKARIWEFYDMASICLVPMKDSPQLEFLTASKIYYIMASGKPIVAAAKGETAEILERSGCAVIVPPEEPARLANVVAALIDNPVKLKQMGESGFNYVQQHFAQSLLSRHYLGVFSKSLKDYNIE